MDADAFTREHAAQHGIQLAPAQPCPVSPIEEVLAAKSKPSGASWVAAPCWRPEALPHSAGLRHPYRAPPAQRRPCCLPPCRRPEPRRPRLPLQVCRGAAGAGVQQQEPAAVPAARRRGAALLCPVGRQAGAVWGQVRGWAWQAGGGGGPRSLHVVLSLGRGCHSGRRAWWRPLPAGTSTSCTTLWRTQR